MLGRHAMTRATRIILAAALLAGGTAGFAAPKAKLPADAPFCAVLGTRPVFVAPMGAVYRAAPGEAYPAARWFAAIDANHDGAIDRAEMVADARAFFATLDLDGDGRLTPEEVAAYERDVAPEIALYAAAREPEPNGGRRARHAGSALLLSGDQGSGYGGPLGAGRYAWLNIPEPVAAADADINRIVSADEFAAAAGRRFDTLDKGHGGRLTLAELGRTPQQIAIEGPCRPRPKPRGRRDEEEGARP